MAGAFIVLEGPDGAGKTTQARRLVEALDRAGRRPLAVREPGGTAIGEKIRAILLDPENEAMDARTELLLYMAARAQLCAEVIRPAVAKGHVVVADRFLASSIVYQGFAGGLGAETVRALADFAIGEVRPTLTIVLDVSAAIAATRGAGREKDRIERRSEDYCERVRAGYRLHVEAARRAGERVVVIDGARPEAEVASDVVRAAMAAIP
jgi:dTMP kinase